MTPTASSQQLNKHEVETYSGLHVRFAVIVYQLHHQSFGARNRNITHAKLLELTTGLTFVPIGKLSDTVWAQHCAVCRSRAMRRLRKPKEP